VVDRVVDRDDFDGVMRVRQAWFSIADVVEVCGRQPMPVRLAFW